MHIYLQGEKEAGGQTDNHLRGNEVQASPRQCTVGIELTPPPLNHSLHIIMYVYTVRACCIIMIMYMSCMPIT